MSNLPVDRDSNYMYQMWGTTKLVSDYESLPQKRVIQEVMHDTAPKHDFSKQVELHEKIRNDEDYNDWDYGTEPNYGKSWWHTINSARKIHFSMAIQKKSQYFKDISLSFDPHPVTKDLPVLINERSIVRSVRNLVETIPTERFFNSLIGSDIRRKLFDFVDYASADIIQDQIKTTISNFEPRVSNVVVQVDPQPDVNTFEISVFFDIVGLEIPTQQFTFLLQATR